MDNYEKVLESIKQLPDQAKQAWEEVNKLDIPQNCKEAKNIVICGMGGSGLPAHLMFGVTNLKVPTVLLQDYSLPAWADKNTLVFLSSYSGNTEEVIACGNRAIEAGCILAGITTGGELVKLLNQNNSLAYVFDPMHNPSGQPRLGLGYNLFGQLALVYKMGLADTEPEGLDKQIDCINVSPGVWEKLETGTDKLAESLKDKLPVFFAAEHLVGSAHVAANQIHETSKTFATYFAIPESNHHLLEGIKHKNGNLFPVFLDSKWYRPANRRGLQVTKELLEKSELSGYSYQPPEDNNRLREVFQTLIFSSLLSLKLSKLYGEDPIAIPAIDYFKEKLEES